MQSSQQGGTYSRPGAEATVLATASNWHRPSNTNHSYETGLASNRSLGTNSNPDSVSGNNRLGGMTQHDSGLGTSNAYTGASHSSESGNNSGHFGPGQSTSYNHHGLSSASPQGQSYEDQSGGFKQGYGQQGQATSMAGHADYEPVPRLPSHGIPPVFHPPSYVTCDGPSYTGGHASNSSDTQGVNAKHALEPLTDIQPQVVGRETSNVNAKQALDPLTHIAAGDRQEDAGEVHAKDALQPLTEVPAHDNNKGIVESLREYLPGQQQTGIVEVSVDGVISSCLAYSDVKGCEKLEAQYKHTTC